GTRVLWIKNKWKVEWSSVAIHRSVVCNLIGLEVLRAAVDPIRTAKEIDAGKCVRRSSQQPFVLIRWIHRGEAVVSAVYIDPRAAALRKRCGRRTVTLRSAKYHIRVRCRLRD